MKFRSFFENQRAVSPVIGVVLMVAITVILAAAIGSSVLGHGASSPAPQAIIDIEAVNNSYVKVEHLGGDPVSFAKSSITKVVASNSSKNLNINFTDLDLFDVGQIRYVKLKNVSDTGGDSVVNISFHSGDIVDFKIIDVASSTFIVNKKVRF